MKTTAITAAVSSPPEENEHWNTKWRRTTSRAGQKPVVDWKNDLQIQGAGRKSQKQPTPVVGIKPYGKCQIKPSHLDRVSAPHKASSKVNFQKRITIGRPIEGHIKYPPLLNHRRIGV